MKTVGLIVAAGKQTRFKSSTPKALFPYQNSTILEVNIETMQKFVSEIYIVVSYNNYSYFTFLEKKYKNVKLIRIFSGYGCGDAVLKALKRIEAENIIQIWGDSIQTNEDIYRKILENLCDNDIVIPVIYEEHPYVSFVEKSALNLNILFEKYSGKLESGFHDLSIFLYRKNVIHHFLQRMYDNELLLNNELIFLDVFNHNFTILSKLLKLEIKPKAFNTIDEYLKLGE